MISAGPLPDWLVRIEGGAPLLFVAPHGGRRAGGATLDEGVRKVNDLHTAELSLELASRLGAAAIVNRAEDRNHIDLNRVSEVRRGAPWLIDLLLADVRRQITAAGEATLVFMHGWNAIQPCCDVGIGARIAGGVLVPVKQGKPTVAPSFLPRLGAFASACGRAAIEVTIGERYPAAGRDNLLQVFTARFADDADPRIRELARFGASGKIAAVQLELAVPLRWPGPLRSRIVEAILTFGGPPEPGAILDALERPRSFAGAETQLALDFHDGAAGVGGFAGVERLASGRRRGRFLLCIGATRLGLFTGEDRPATVCDDLRCAGLTWKRGESGEVVLEYDGPCLTFPRTDPFLDLEAGLSEAELSRLEARLEWRPLAVASNGEHARFGRITGGLRHDGWSTSIAAPAILEHGRRSESRHWRERRILRIPLGPQTFVSIVSYVDATPRIEGKVVCQDRIEPILSGRVSIRHSATGLAPETLHIEAVSPSGALRVLGDVTHAVPVIRPMPEGRLLTFFGLARFRTDAGEGFGTFEVSRKLVPQEKGSER